MESAVVRNIREQFSRGREEEYWVEITNSVCVCVGVTKEGISVWGSLVVPIQTPQLTDPETTDMSTKRQSTNSTRSFAITDNDGLHEGLNYLMVKMRREDGGRKWRIEGGREGRQRVG